jgi:hypothetical protein
LFETDGEEKAKSLSLQEMEPRSVILWPAYVMSYSFFFGGGDSASPDLLQSNRIQTQEGMTQRVSLSDEASTSHKNPSNKQGRRNSFCHYLKFYV